MSGRSIEEMAARTRLGRDLVEVALEIEIGRGRVVNLGDGRYDRTPRLSLLENRDLGDGALPAADRLRLRRLDREREG